MDTIETTSKVFGRNRGIHPLDDATASPPRPPSSPVERQRERAAAAPLRTRAEVQGLLDRATKELHRLDGELTAARRWSHDTARRFMQVADVFGQIRQIGKFAPSALYALASGTDD